MSSDVFNSLRSFIAQQAAVDFEEVTQTALIEDDLGVTGDDAVEFIIAFGMTFNVDVSNFMAAEYFGPDGGISLPKFLDTNKRNRKQLSVMHLQKAIVAGRLDENIINKLDSC